MRFVRSAKRAAGQLGDARLLSSGSPLGRDVIRHNGHLQVIFTNVTSIKSIGFGFEGNFAGGHRPCGGPNGQLGRNRYDPVADQQYVDRCYLQ